MPTDPLRPGDPAELGGYHLLGRLGEGGMGAVYLGRGPDGNLVAVKAIRPELAHQSEFRGRFRSEVNRARQVPAFCTAPVLDADPESETPYLVVEYVDGPSLADVVTDRGPLSGGDLYSVAIGVATALTAIHGAGVIHRDLKPRNVLFSLGTPKVIDFGIARAFEATSNHTRTDQMVGTVSYMAPERFDGDSSGVGPASDVFAWGVVVAYAATGRTPFGADSPAATAARILTQPPQLGNLPSPLREIVDRSLAKNPADRPSSTELLDLLLDTGSHGVGDLAGSPELRQAAQAARAGGRSRQRRRRSLLAAAGAGVATLAVLGAAGGIALKNSALDEPAAPVEAAPTPRIGNGPMIIDPLGWAAQWTVKADGRNTCRFRDGHLVATTPYGESSSCPGPKDIIGGDQSIAVTVSVPQAGSCAYISFRRIEDTVGYHLTLCRGEITVTLDTKGAATTVGTARSTAFADGKDHRVGLEILDDVATVSLDGAEVLTADVDDRRLISGWIELGVENELETTADYAQVTFKDVEIRTL
ncbi:serine/threonine-protein kinase [Actinoplanes rectilineatus]|uniref:serine/threonine-protein kinase n=1 Tax=Actinoplanes rectilineatus TaxID=113571 RepID=UPI0009F88692|nr:serine/threonine-protein kinase [Actinoplanes rectilineatus]